MKSFAAVVVLLSCTLVTANPMEVVARQTLSTITLVVPTTLAESCTFRPTATVTATTGCPTTCSNVGICFADYPVTLACGCARMAVQPTTETVCPTATACTQCQTGWGITTITPTTCLQTPVPLPTAV
ncbi:hypothetical protein N8I77_011764 [Diaporthe amygdali]|uniref:Uncharacterized protein n=1 Tax=Phomopsis amygdali TaxID=1214568 RepID=A0AAD9S4V8_PHOAM|nr:hypothetical protein N8I77_011764 [Diaporthe amygdali]